MTLSVPTKLWRVLSLNSPIVSSALAASALGLIGWYGAPLLKNKLNEWLGGRGKALQYDTMFEDNDKDLRRAAAVALGISGAAIPIAANFSSDDPGYGLFQYSPLQPLKIEKDASGLPTLSLGAASQLIHDNPKLAPEMKMNALGLLESFNAPQTAQISGGDLVGQAIATGRSAATGAAIGYTTASILGLDNPKSAAIFGAVANTLGLAPALASSLIFGS